MNLESEDKRPHSVSSPPIEVGRCYLKIDDGLKRAEAATPSYTAGRAAETSGQIDAVQQPEVKLTGRIWLQYSAINVKIDSSVK